MNHTTDWGRRWRNTGYITFFLSGICAISSGIIVSILQGRSEFDYGMTGTMLGLMSIGNMAASFAAGILAAENRSEEYSTSSLQRLFPGVLSDGGDRNAGDVLMAAFLLVGFAKGGALNNCTILVKDNSADRTRSMNILHACYACGALLCPFLAASLLGINDTLPMVGVAVTGLLLWMIFLTAGLPGAVKEKNGERGKISFAFLKDPKFWLITGLLFCQNAAETSVTGWLVTYYKDMGILSGSFAAYTVTVMWGATLIARLLIAFVFPVHHIFRTLVWMGGCCSVLYCGLVYMQHPAGAIAMLFAFAFAMAGVNPIAVAGAGREMNATSLGVMLPVAGIGAIVMPWLIGVIADRVGLVTGMFCNLIPCVGILVFSVLILKYSGKELNLFFKIKVEC